MQYYYYFEDNVELKGPGRLPKSDPWRSGLHNADPATLLSFMTPEGVDISYRPQIKVGHDTPHDQTTEVREQTGHVVTATEVTDTWTVRAMTQHELDDIEADQDAMAEERTATPEAKMIYHIIHGTVPAAVQNEVPPAKDNFKQWYRNLS
jgi:hypothetical protein